MGNCCWWWCVSEFNAQWKLDFQPLDQLGDAARVNLTFGCRMGDATLRDVGCNCGVL
jgi:hypothetical protein